MDMLKAAGFPAAFIGSQDAVCRFDVGSGRASAQQGQSIP